MNLKELETSLQQILRKKVHTPVSSFEISPVGGGSINNTCKVTVNNRHPFFIKINSASGFPSLFDKEKNGLNFLADQKIIKTPLVIDYSIVNDSQILILEWVQPGGRSSSFWKLFGEQVAALHHISNKNFGFAEDNYMGALPQRNNLTSTWPEFFIHHRLRPQVSIAEKKGLLNPTSVHQFEVLYEKLDTIFNKEVPSLLHGDLWSGNFMCNQDSQPVIIDPAVYFGHRAIDLAMTTLFGGFDKSFYEAYQYHFPLPHNYRDQWNVSNLYPLLIHLNLFGSSYLHDITTILKKFTA